MENAVYDVSYIKEGWFHDRPSAAASAQGRADRHHLYPAAPAGAAAKGECSRSEERR